MQLICIDDTYSKDQLEVFGKHGIKFPKVDELVTLLRIEKLPRIGKIGFIVSPYDGQYIKGINFGVEGEKEVSFNYKRFAKLDTTEFTEEEVISLIKELNQVEKL